MTRIISGGQSGADRAALDAARGHGLPSGGWCPRGGWAEDFPFPPGLLAAYPELAPTPLEDPLQRTEWNVRDSDATVVFRCQGASPPGLCRSGGTEATVLFARRLGRPLLVSAPEDTGLLTRWVASLPHLRTLNVAGPRESECPGLYRAVRASLERAFRTWKLVGAPASVLAPATAVAGS